MEDLQEEQPTEHLRKLHQLLRAEPLPLRLDINDINNNNDNKASKTEPITIIDAQYKEKLQKGISIRKAHLKRAKGILIEQQQDLDRSKQLDAALYGIKEEMNGVYFTNDRVPYHVERGDLIGVSLASVKMHGQLQQSKEIVQRLEMKSRQLQERLDVQEQNRLNLEALVEGLQSRADQGRKGEEELGKIEKMERLVAEERARYKKLKEYSKDMRREYE